MIRCFLALCALLLPASAIAQGVVTSADPRATEAGREILRQGGSATDAAMAMMLALTVVDCDRMIAARDRAGGMLMVGYVNRYRNGPCELKAAMDRGDIGSPMFADIYQFASQEKYIGGWILKRETLGGGCFFSSAGHLLDLLLWFHGPVERLHVELARYQQTVLRALEDTGNALVRFDRAHDADVELERAARDSARAAQLARLRFDAGATGLLEVLDAERTQLQAEDAYASGRTRTATDAVALYRALAGGWPQTLPARETAGIR